MKTVPLAILSCVTALNAAGVQVPAGIDHSDYDALLQRYVDERGRVDYRAWSESDEDLNRLDAYLEQFAPDPDAPAEGDERIASLVNAYNALTLDFILEHFPAESIRVLDDPFNGKRHPVGGRKVSLDEIEHDTLRPLIGWKVHSLVVCAARSCPPLWNRAYTADNWEQAVRDRYRVWLAREDLNRYHPDRNLVEISKIFDWYGEDFEDDHSLRRILARFGPAEHREFLSGDAYKIKFKDYHWGLNAQSDLGRDYKHSFLKSLF